MKQNIIHLFLFLFVCFLFYFIFRNSFMREGLTNNTSSISTDGIAGNASAYGANIKAEVIKMQDIALISKYRQDYESVVLNLDDYVNNLMLKTALNMDMENPEKTLLTLSQLNQSKDALNNIIKFIDST